MSRVHPIDRIAAVVNSTPCPWCKAPRHFRCHTTAGRVLPGLLHHDRIQAFRDRRPVSPVTSQPKEAQF